MMFGLCMSVVNFVHFKRYYKILLEFIPQMIFLVCLFLWLVILMILKWLMYNADEGEEIQWGSSCAPSVLILFINMMLLTETVVEGEALKGCEPYMFSFQQQMQLALVFIAVACIPIILLGVPLYTMHQRKSKRKAMEKNGDINQGMELRPESLEVGKSNSESHEEEEEEPMGEVFIHQAIHTIEYVLSTISHTASYLRLWALSLAHGQLSEVLWSMVLKFGLASDNYVGSALLFPAFAAWASLTLAILVAMEGLSAFLHTLRLHWVEFMSKFYEGAGYIFQPFCFKQILEGDEEE